MTGKLSDMIKNKETLKKNVKNLGGNPSLINIINAYLSNRPNNYFHPFKAEISRNDLIGFHPSGLHNACPRQLAFGLIKEKNLFRKEVVVEDFSADNNLPPNVKRTFDLGHLIHMLLQYSYLPDYNKKMVKTEVAIETLYDKYLIGGTADLLVNMQDAKWWMWDIKSIRTELFRKLNNFSDVGGNYVVQFNIYLFGLKIPRGGVLYFDKNDGNMKEFLFKYDPEVIKEPIIAAKTAKAFLEGKIVPPVLHECTQKKGKYKNCAFASICFRCKSNKDLLGFTTATNNKLLVKKEYKADVESRKN